MWQPFARQVGRRAEEFAEEAISEFRQGESLLRRTITVWKSETSFAQAGSARTIITINGLPNRQLIPIFRTLQVVRTDPS